MFMPMVKIEMPKNLAELFIELCENASEEMGNAGCNDFDMKDTPQNRELLNVIEAHGLDMTFEEYLASDEYSEPHVHRGKICCADFTIFDYAVSIIKKAIKETERNK